MKNTRKSPQLRCLLICGEVDEGEGGTPDAYNIMSQTTIISEPNDAQFYELQLYLLVSIYTERENETYPLTLTVESPTGHEGEIGRISLGSVSGRFLSTFASPLRIEMDTPGTYWVKAYHRDEFLGETSLKVEFSQRVAPVKSNVTGH